MIPKKIHYCWLSGEKIPEILQKSMATWKEFLPDYEWALWDKNKFDINSVDFVKEACSVKKWAFAADYIRLYAVYTEGGIYMDMDVIVKKSFDKFLKHDFFSAVENNTAEKDEKRDFLIQAAIFGAVAGHPYLKDCMKWYENRHFILPDGSFFNNFIAPNIYAKIAENYGFSKKDELQNLSNGMTIYQSEVFPNARYVYTKETHAIHWARGSWKPRNFLWKILCAANYNLFLLRYFGGRLK